MGCIESKKVNLVLTQDDLNFLIARTRFDEDTIKEWFKGSIELNPNHFHEKSSKTFTLQKKCATEWILPS